MHRRLRHGLVVALGAAIPLVACQGRIRQAAGLELVFKSDLQVPADFDTLYVVVSKKTGDTWSQKLAHPFALSQFDPPLPQSISIATGTDPSPEALIQVTALKGGESGNPVLYEETLVELPSDRVASLLVFLSSKCVDKVVVTHDGYQSTCGADSTCDPMSGNCVSSTVDVKSLPTFSPSDLSSNDVTPDGSAPDAVADATMDGGAPDAGPAEGGELGDAASDAGSGGPTRDADEAGGPCVSGGSCAVGACRTGEYVCADGGAVCVAKGTLPNGTACTVAPEGADAGPPSVCFAGTCTACAAGADCSTTASCNRQIYDCSGGLPVCIDAGSQPEGTPCGKGQYCYSGVCSACTVGAACTPANPCHSGNVTSCAGGQATCTDSTTPAPNGTICGSNAVCNGGACSACAGGATCTPTSVCHVGKTSCATGSSVCVDTGANAPDGTSCGPSAVCNAGACAAPAALSMSPSPFNYGSVPPGVASTDVTFTVKNVGGLSTGGLGTGISGATPGQFIISSDTCSKASLGAGMSCIVKVHFSPGLAGPYSATLSVSANPGGSASAALAGTSGAPCGVIVSDSSTIALWHFDDASGLTTADASGNGHDGLLGNSTTPTSAAPTWTTGRFAGALFYASANSQYVQGQGANTFPNNQVTVEYWEKAVAPYGSGSGGYSQTLTAGFIDVAVNVSTYDMEFGVGDGNNWSYPSAPTTVLTDGNWHYLAYVYDGINQLFYVDGVKVGAATAKPAVVLTSTGGYGYQIGGRPYNTFFDGTIDEMRLSSVARTGAQIANYYNSAVTCP